MRLLAFSDLHRDTNAARKIVEASEEADVVIGAGDFATKGIGASETLKILATCHAPVLIVHGNHDAPGEIAALCARWPNVTYLHGTGVRIGGVDFFGVGGEVPKRKAYDWNTAHSEDEAARMLTACPAGAVLITHTPPLGTADLQKNGAHEGSAAIRDAITAHNAVLCLCGHIHASWGAGGQVGCAHVRNLGPVPNWFDIGARAGQ
ncbi:metallophosphoesterase family protein [Roseovarius arcticus]|uniref:metallophosphoesterase family protein n=1 Tax=Roseovarius arcticus TaxID=2547404 RepID=UPI001485E78A|nr:metallophosphoesterase family protein [Roseovarius arcticus]